MIRLAKILFSAKNAERHFFEIFLLGFFYASLSLILSIWIFPDYASLIMVFLTVISCLYVVQSAFIIEENNENKDEEESFLLIEHSRAIKFLLSLFLGFLVAFVFWTLILPAETSNLVFSLQKHTVENIQNMNSEMITGNSISYNRLEIILENNLRVLLFSLILAIFYGAGSIFILAWNASIMGFAIGAVTKNTLGLSSLPLAFTKYLIHGIPEMIAYFIAALAGGIIYVMIVRGDLSKYRLKRSLIDLSVLILISVIILVAAGLIENYISPLL